MPEELVVVDTASGEILAKHTTSGYRGFIDEERALLAEPNEKHLNVVTLNLESGEKKPLFVLDNAELPTLVSAPRLGRVAYVSELPQSQVLSSGLTLRDLASGKETPLSVTETGAKESSQKLFAPKLSPDAERVVFHSYAAGDPQRHTYQYQIRVARSDGSECKMLEGGSIFHEPEWVSNTEVAVVARSGHVRIKALEGKQIGPMLLDRFVGF
jgi:hypothetical protein